MPHPCHGAKLCAANERQWIKDCFMMVDKAKTGQIDNKQLRFAITALGIDASAAAIEVLHPWVVSLRPVSPSARIPERTVGPERPTPWPCTATSRRSPLA